VTQEAKSKTFLSEAIKNNGELPVEWECGCDQTIVWFKEWGEGNDHKEDLKAAFEFTIEKIVSILALPNASESVNEGGGSVFIDEKGNVSLKYSMLHVAYSYFDEKLPESLQPTEQVVISLEDYTGPNCNASVEVEYSQPGCERWSEFIYFNPKLEAPHAENIRASLEKIVPPMYEAGEKYFRNREELGYEEFLIKGFYMDSNVNTKKQTLTYDLTYNYEVAIEVSKEETVELY